MVAQIPQGDVTHLFSFVFANEPIIFFNFTNEYLRIFAYPKDVFSTATCKTIEILGLCWTSFHVRALGLIWAFHYLIFFTPILGAINLLTCELCILFNKNHLETYKNMSSLDEYIKNVENAVAELKAALQAA